MHITAIYINIKEDMQTAQQSAEKKQGVLQHSNMHFFSLPALSILNINCKLTICILFHQVIIIFK